MRTKWIIWLGTLLLLTWAICVSLSPNATNATALSGVNIFGSRIALAAVLWVVGLSTLAALLLGKHGRWANVALSVQQAILFLAAYASLEAVIRGQYADGVPRPHLFMLADQVPAILGFALHTFAVLEMGGIKWTVPQQWRSRRSRLRP